MYFDRESVFGLQDLNSNLNCSSLTPIGQNNIKCLSDARSRSTYMLGP